jgi:hypothetical protein
LFRFAKPVETIEDKRAKARVEKREALEKDNADKLNRYAWKDQKTGAVQLPVARAMELVIADRGEGKRPATASAVKVEQPYPVGLIPPPGANPAVAPGPAPGTNPSGSPAPAAPNTNAPELKKAQ